VPSAISAFNCFAWSSILLYPIFYWPYAHFHSRQSFCTICLDAFVLCCPTLVFSFVYTVLVSFVAYTTRATLLLLQLKPLIQRAAFVPIRLHPTRSPHQILKILKNQARLSKATHAYVLLQSPAQAVDFLIRADPTQHPITLITYLFVSHSSRIAIRLDPPHSTLRRLLKSCWQAPTNLCALTAPQA